MAALFVLLEPVVRPEAALRLAAELLERNITLNVIKGNQEKAEIALDRVIIKKIMRK
jgi:hypothetical protein